MTTKKNFPKQRGKAKWVKIVEPHESELDSDFPMLHIGKPSSVHPITVKLQVNHRKLTMEVDTGAAVSIISEETQKKLFPDARLIRAPVKLRTYTGEPMPVVGEMSVEVKYGSQTSRLTLIVVEGTGPSLFGHDWLQHLRLDWKSIGIATLDKTMTQVEALQKKYEDVFSSDLGSMRHFQARLQVKEGAIPVFHRPRPVPFAIKRAIEKELDRLEEEGIMEK